MPAPKPRPADAKSQSERFIETARELGVPEDEATFEAFKGKLGQIARHKPADMPEPTPQRKRESA
jgi:hypothetical protein